MYRESLPGLALAATLQELAPSLALTEAQTESIWRVFDRAVESALAEAPLMSRIRVRCPPPAIEDLLPASLGGNTVTLTENADADSGVVEGGAQSPPHQRQPVARSADCDVVFPVYRCVDDEWTLLLKNPTVEVRDEFGAEETLRLDYLRVHLRNPAAPPSAREPKTKRPRKH